MIKPIFVSKVQSDFWLGKTSVNCDEVINGVNPKTAPSETEAIRASGVMRDNR
ncbi:MAG: hypothetical protein ACI8VW_003234 [bacterium]